MPPPIETVSPWPTPGDPLIITGKGAASQQACGNPIALKELWHDAHTVKADTCKMGIKKNKSAGQSFYFYPMSDDSIDNKPEIYTTPVLPEHHQLLEVRLLLAKLKEDLKMDEKKANDVV
jgi:hypothetical protein